MGDRIIDFLHLYRHSVCSAPSNTLKSLAFCSSAQIQWFEALDSNHWICARRGSPSKVVMVIGPSDVLP
jgi:hypothetical protein